MHLLWQSANSKQTAILKSKIYLIMNTEKGKEKQSKIKQNSKKALDYLKAKNPNLQYLINAFALELSQEK
jgi:hypothetical protein